MSFHYIAFGIPLIFTVIGLEYYLSRRKGKRYFSFASNVSNISIGIAERLAQLFLTGYFILVFHYLHAHFALFDIQPGLFSWIGVFLLTDFIWYWYHRLSHEVNLFWGAHVVHHSSEEYNYTVSLRITIFQAFIRLFFGMFLPLAGFPVHMLMISISVLGIYQFFLHTRLIRSLGVLEYLLVSPSHHRVHHGSNPKYLDKNYGGLLIIWDRLFKTFEAETEEVRYGLTKQVDSHSFLWLHFHYWLDLREHVRRTRGFIPRLKILFGRPDRLPESHEARLRARFLSGARSGPELPDQRHYPVLHTYIKLQLILSVALLFLLYLVDLPALNAFLLSGILLLSVINCGAILEQKTWVFAIEVIRLVFVYVLIVSFSELLLFYAYLPFLLIIILDDYRWFRHQYIRLIFRRR